MTSPLRHFYEFGAFRLDAADRVLFRESELVPVTPKAFDTLLMLVEHRGHVVTREQLVQAVWPDTFVEEAGLTRNISVLRRTLGAGDEDQRFIETIPKRGYRFVAPVREVAEAAAAPQRADASPSREPAAPDSGASRPRSPSLSVVGPDETVATAGEGASRGEARSFPATHGWPASPRGLAVSLVLVAVAAAGGIYLWIGSRSTPAPLGAQVRSLAVLPFKPLVAAERDEYLELGMADALITRLSNLRQVVVRPTSAVVQYAGGGQDPLAAGRALKVDAVLDGSVQRAGDRIRVTVQLIRVRDGRPLWADAFEQQWTHIFAVQNAISAKAAALRLTLSGEEKERLTRRDTGSTEAYQLYLKGRYASSRRTEEGLKQAIEYFEEALHIDPTYAMAYAALADTYTSFSVYSVLPPTDAYPKAEAAALKALELDDTLAGPHTTLGLVRLYYNWDWVGAEREFRRALVLKPQEATAHHRYAIALVWVERFDEALHEITRARELDPLSLIINANVGTVLYYARRYDQAIAELRHALELEPTFFQAHQWLGRAYVQKGMYDEAIAAFNKAIQLGGGPFVVAHLGHCYAVSGQTSEAMKRLGELLELSQRRYVSPFALALVYTGLGEKDRALSWLRKSAEEHSRDILSLNVAPVFDTLRSDPRFAELVRRVGLFKSK